MTLPHAIVTKPILAYIWLEPHQCPRGKLNLPIVQCILKSERVQHSVRCRSLNGTAVAVHLMLFAEHAYTKWCKRRTSQLGK